MKINYKCLQRKQRIELDKMKIEELKSLYIQETKALHEQLLQGIPWENLETQRKYISAIGVFIDIKSNNYNVS